MSAIEIGSIPANGSSSSMIDGSAASARAISQRRRSPPDKRHRRGIAKVGEPEFLEQLLEPLAARALVGLGDLENGEDILFYGHSAEDRCLLRQIAEAEDRPAVHRKFGDVLPVEEDSAAVRLHQAHDRIEAGRLAGAVRAEQADDFAAVDVERHVVKHGPPVIDFRNRVNLEPDVRPLRLGGRTREGRSFIHAAISFRCFFAEP